MQVSFYVKLMHADPEAACEPRLLLLFKSWCLLTMQWLATASSHQKGQVCSAVGAAIVQASVVACAHRLDTCLAKVILRYLNACIITLFLDSADLLLAPHSSQAWQHQ